MRWDEVLEGMKEGYAYTRDAWKGTGYVCMSRGTVIRVDVRDAWDGRDLWIRSYRPDEDDWKADDWTYKEGVWGWKEKDI